MYQDESSRGSGAATADGRCAGPFAWTRKDSRSPLFLPQDQPVAHDLLESHGRTPSHVVRRSVPHELARAQVDGEHVPVDVALLQRVVEGTAAGGRVEDSAGDGEHLHVPAAAPFEALEGDHPVAVLLPGEGGERTDVESARTVDGPVRGVEGRAVGGDLPGAPRPCCRSRVRCCPSGTRPGRRPSRRSRRHSPASRGEAFCSRSSTSPCHERRGGAVVSRPRGWRWGPSRSPSPSRSRSRPRRPGTQPRPAPPPAPATPSRAAPPAESRRRREIGVPGVVSATAASAGAGRRYGACSQTSVARRAMSVRSSGGRWSANSPWPSWRRAVRSPVVGRASGSLERQAVRIGSSASGTPVRSGSA